MNYHKLAFTDVVKSLQEANGSRSSYAQTEMHSDTQGLSDNERFFIAQRDSFYMASVGENGYPYIQHRGGPEGFIKVIDSQRIGIVDFAGNKQYISVGNIQTNPRVALILVSYPDKARLKIYADVKVVAIQDDPALFDALDPEDYKHRPERMMVFDVKAFDWNCPQHITQRFTLPQIEKVFDSQQQYIEKIERENKELKQKLGIDTKN